MHKIFISHHHSDAVALSDFKDKLKPIGFRCFLAHEDINPGEHDLDTIENEIRECDAFLYIGGKDANKSSFCQQEIGAARALKKEIIPTMTKGNSPKGFIGRIQAISYQKINDDFLGKISIRLLEIFPPPEEVKDHLKVLGAKGFFVKSIPNKVKLIPNTIYLQPSNWNDFGYLTLFSASIGNQSEGEVKIGYINQPTRTHTYKKLPSFFTHLQLPFFSRVQCDQRVLPQEKIKSLHYLLNETTLMSDEDQKKVINEGVYETSLCRDEK